MARRMGPQRAERGAALGIVILSSIVFSVAAFAVLNMSMSRAQTAAFEEGRLRARYAAEAGLVKAMQLLWNGTMPPGMCGPGVTWSYDTDNDGTFETPVLVTASVCSVILPNTLTAKVTF